MSKEALDGSRVRRGSALRWFERGGLAWGASRCLFSCLVFNWLVLEKGGIKALAAKREIFGLNRKTHLFSHQNSV